MNLLDIAIAKKMGGGGDEPTGTKEISITQNGVTTENVKSYASAKITTNVPNSYAAGDESKVVSNGALVAQTSVTKTANGTYDTTTNNSVTVNVPQPSGTKSITSNGTHDVSSYASANVNVPSGTPTIQSLSVTQNGTYTAPSGVDGYSPVTVNVSGGGGLTPIVDTTVTVSTTSTSVVEVKTISFPFADYKGKTLLIKIEDVAGMREGYFYKWQCTACCNMTTGNPIGFAGALYKYANSDISHTSFSSTASGSYGVYASPQISDNTIEIRAVYNSTRSTTIDGTYSVKIYAL